MDDTEQAQWAQLEQEQAMLRADPCFIEWLDFLELTQEQDQCPTSTH